MSLRPTISFNACEVLTDLFSHFYNLSTISFTTYNLFLSSLFYLLQ